jgi:hypothetical protein
MTKEKLIQSMLEKYPQIRRVNLLLFTKEQLIELDSTGKVTLTKDTLFRIFDERNQRADINAKLNRDNFGLKARMKSLATNLTDWSKSEIINLYKSIFGGVTRDDDSLLKQIGAASQETVIADLSKAESIVQEAKDIASAYQQKYSLHN